jgi:uncharacterized cupredoxin-like copper-binding protein
MTPMQWMPRLLGGAGVTALGLLAACGSGGPTGTDGTVVGVTLSEFVLTPSPTSVPPGAVFFAARNVGQGIHEVVVLQTDRVPDALPVTGSQVDETASGIQRLGRIGNIQPGASAGQRIDLGPGRYVLICNIAGHYQQGMRAALRVP